MVAELSLGNFLGKSDLAVKSSILNGSAYLSAFVVSVEGCGFELFVYALIVDLTSDLYLYKGVEDNLLLDLGLTFDRQPYL